MTLTSRIIPSFFIGVIALLADRLSKYIVFLRYSNYDAWSIMGFLQFRPFYNTGTVFGWQIDPSVVTLSAWLGTLGVLIVSGIWFARASRTASSYQLIACALLCAGALSNLYDRMVYGAVLDWIEIPGFTIFNLADISVVFGAALLLVSLMDATIEKE